MRVWKRLWSWDIPTLVLRHRCGHCVDVSVGAIQTRVQLCSWNGIFIPRISLDLIHYSILVIIKELHAFTELVGARLLILELHQDELLLVRSLQL